MKTQHGEFIELIWPDGNDEGELFIRGHVDDTQARNILLKDGDELYQLASDALFDPPDHRPGDGEVAEQARSMLDNARIERIYARWSTEASMETDITLRPYRERGRGRFPVTRVLLWPRLPCQISHLQRSGQYECRHCGRTMQGPREGNSLNGPADCKHRQGDEPGPFTQIHSE